MTTSQTIYPTQAEASSPEAPVAVTLRIADPGLRAVVVAALDAALPAIRILADDAPGAAAAPAIEVESTLPSIPTTEPDDEHPVWSSLRRTRRLLKAGQAALGIRHSLNNPLTAILAEAQLLELEDLPEEHAQSVKRIVEQARRMIGITRSLDGSL